ncbi:MAG: hypothetical protein SX243_14250 [Acidobacteriota bacterium]|nr:hypothetical protein [Acidobacteriota bacterium]
MSPNEESSNPAPVHPSVEASGSQGGTVGVDHLLRPSLAARATAEPLYSVRASFLTAFFGGVFATSVFCGLSARRAGRLQKDLWILVLASVAWAVILVWAGHGIVTNSLPAWLSVGDSSQRGVRYAGRVLGLALFGIIYLRHRFIYRALALVGDEPPNPWRAALTAIGGSILLSLLFVGLGVMLGGGVPTS